MHKLTMLGVSEMEGYRPPVKIEHDIDRSPTSEIIGFLDNVRIKNGIMFGDIVEINSNNLDFVEKYPYISIEVIPENCEIVSVAMLGDKPPFHKFPALTNYNKTTKNDKTNIINVPLFQPTRRTYGDKEYDFDINWMKDTVNKYWKDYNDTKSLINCARKGVVVGFDRKDFGMTDKEKEKKVDMQEEETEATEATETAETAEGAEAIMAMIDELRKGFEDLVARVEAVEKVKAEEAVEDAEDVGKEEVVENSRFAKASEIKRLEKVLADRDRKDFERSIKDRLAIAHKEGKIPANLETAINACLNLPNEQMTLEAVEKIEKTSPIVFERTFGSSGSFGTDREKEARDFILSEPMLRKQFEKKSEAEQNVFIAKFAKKL